MIETHRSFANMWECDENNHMNVQFFVKRFEEALDVFGAICNKEQSGAHPLRHRHIRFHNEIRAGESLQILSGQVAEGEYKGQVVHHLLNCVSGELCTTAVDCCPTPFVSEFCASEKDLSIALPRGVPKKELPPFDSERLIKSGEALAANYYVPRTHDLDENGNFLTSRIVSMFTDGAPHVWEKAGVLTDWLNANGFGRVAVEMRLAPFGKPILGQPLRLVSRVGELQGRTFRLDHQIETLGENKMIASGSVRGLVMDLTTRKAVQLPDGFSATLK